MTTKHMMACEFRWMVEIWDAAICEWNHFGTYDDEQEAYDIESDVQQNGGKTRVAMLLVVHE
jgi:hypothetical protein